ncbi:MAG: dnaG [Acidobacteria bacterium]|nr:dnaG [Acidobacteriota bacterium]
MALFPQSFIDEVRAAADIVEVVQETVPLRRVGATYKGLCPFHGEKTPSFHVNRDKGFFHCFGCGIGGDVFKFVELRDKVGFGEAARSLAQRFGVPVPDVRDGGRDPSADAERETLLKIHEVAASWFREQLARPEGARARQQLAARGLSAGTIDALGLGYAPPSREALKMRLQRQGFDPRLILASGLVVARDDGPAVDRFRNRLMIPIARESGTVVAFGGRAMEADQGPKYLNSPETPIYSKSRTLYGLHLTRADVRRAGMAVLVEGYFDFAQAWQAGIAPVVATCGTALTPAQAQLLRRFASRVVLSFDPDSAGQGAAARSSDLLVAEGFQVAVALLPPGDDPDTLIRRSGPDAYRALVDQARPYLEFLLDRAAAAHDLSGLDGRQAFVHEMLAVAARIPEATGRDQFADRLAHTARIAEDVIRAEIRKAAVARRTTLPGRQLPMAGVLKPAERHLLAALLTQPAEAGAALAELDEEDVQGLSSASILRAAKALAAERPESLPGVLLERLTEEEAGKVTAEAARPDVVAPPVECVRALRRLRYERERAAVQRELDRLQERGPAVPAAEVDALLQRKSDLLSRLEALNV